MPKCEVRRGFLILRECGNATTRLCSACGRGACEEHLVSGNKGTWLCVDCQGRQEKPDEPDEPDQPDLTADQDTTRWRHSYRDRYYRDQHYAPLMTGIYFGSYYDDYDARGFDQQAAPDQAPEDDGGTDFMDS
jgi:hypothetical protein